MNIKKIIILVSIVIVIGIIFYLIFCNFHKDDSSNTISEYTPQEEISQDELRKTIVSVYFKNIEIS